VVRVLGLCGSACTLVTVSIPKDRLCFGERASLAFYHVRKSYRTSVSAAGGELVLSSFFWLVYDGMKLNPVHHAFQFHYLNNVFFPYTYRHMERLAAFQNRVLRKFAELRGVPFLDIAGAMPRDPDLFMDAVHATDEGIRLHAWIAAHRRRQSSLGSSSMCAFPANLPLHHCAAIIPLPPIEVPQSFEARLNGAPRIWLRLEAQVNISGGDAQIGILSRDGQEWLTYGTIKQADKIVTLDTAWDRAVGPLVVTAGTAHSNEVTLELRDDKIMAISGVIKDSVLGLREPSR
jgi:hypothetical protein